jgi:branched-chain amino acid transport system substrate-binding protein
MKNRIVKENRLGIILGLALVALLLVTACAPTPTAPTGEKTVEVGALFPITGGAGTQHQAMLKSMEDYVRYFNEQEAIPGVNIKLSWTDTYSQYAQVISGYERFVRRGIPILISTESQTLRGLNERFAEDKIPVLGSATGFQNLSYSPGWRYFQCPTPAEHTGVVLGYFMENWEEDRPPRVAFVIIEVDFGYDLLSEGAKYAESLGFEVLPHEVVPYVVIDATPQLIRLEAEAADLVYLQVLASGAGPILRDAERLGLLEQMHFAGSELGMPEGTIEFTGAASEGYLMAMTTPWFDETEVPGIRLIIDNQMKYHGNVERDPSTRNGFIVAVLSCEAVQRAIEDVGYDNLDGVAIKEVLDNMEDFDVYGLASITYTDPLDHRGITKLAIHQVTGGKIVRVTDFQEVPSLVPEGLVRE